jgi:ABC-type tungstate transport system substrate-binding protein
VCWSGLLNTLLALPSVVVGLLVYLLLSRSGPLGSWGLLFTPTAMVIAQSILVVPLIAALTRRLVLDGLRRRRRPAAIAGRRAPADGRACCCCTSAVRC